MEVGVLGPMRVLDQAGPIPLPSAKPRAVLTALALRPGMAVSVREMIAILWGDGPPRSAEKLVQVYVSQLRRALPAGTIITVAGGYVLAVKPDQVDAGRFEELVRRARLLSHTGDAEQAVSVLGEALGLWRGRPLTDVADQAVGQAEMIRLEELRRGAQEDLVEVRLALGQHREVVADLEVAVQAEPLRERRWAQLMLALYRSGRQGEALRAFTRMRKLLAEELGIEPSGQLRQLETDILNQAPWLHGGPLPPAGGTAPMGGRDGLPSVVGGSSPAGSERSRPGLPAALLSVAEGRLLGRVTELARLQRTVQGNPDRVGLVLVAGEAGVGKTRLAAAAARSALDSGGRVMFGRCDEGLRAPYQPFVEAFSGYVDQVTTDELVAQLRPNGAELTRLVPGLAEHAPAIGEPKRGPPETERWYLFQAVASFLRSLSSGRRVVIVIDDLQWAEPATLLMLRHVARAVIDRLVIVATARTANASQLGPLEEALADLAGRHLLETVLLEGLSQDETGALLADRLNRQPSTDFVAAVHAQTGGNAFFVHELVSHLSDTGVLHQAQVTWPTAMEVEQSGASTGIRHVLSHRLAQLSPATGRALAVASAAGVDFEAGHVAQVTEIDIGEVTTWMDEAVASGLIAETGPTAGCYRFAHALVQHTLYQSLSRLRRAQLHWRMAEALRRSADPGTSRLTQTAYHYRLGVDAGDAVVALEYVHRAADEAVGQLAFEQASELYKAALAISDRCSQDPSRRYDLLSGWGQSAAAAADFDASHQAWLLAANLAESLGDVQRFYRAVHRWSGIVTVGTEDTTVLRLCDRGLNLAGPDESAVRARFLAMRASFDLTYPSRQEMVREALAMARRLGDEPTEARVLWALAWTLWGTSRGEELLEISERGIRIGRHHGYEFSAAYLQRDVALAAIQLGRESQAAKALEHAEAVARAERRRLELHDVLIIQAAMMIAKGHFAQAKQLARETRDIGDPKNLAVALGYAAQIAAIRAEQGRGDEIVEQWTAPVEQGLPGTAAWRTFLVALRADLGEFDEAAERFDTLAVDHFAIIPRDWAFPLAVRYLPEICAQLGDRQRAEQLLPEIEPYRGQLLVVALGTSIEGAADRSLGQLYALLGRYQEADRLFESAYRLETAMGFPALAARTRYWQARLTRATRHHQQNQRLAEARQIASNLGMGLLEHQAAELHGRTT